MVSTSLDSNTAFCKVIVIVILIAGGVYFWMTKTNQVPVSVEQQKSIDQLEAAVIEADNALSSIENDIGISGVESLDLENAVKDVK